MQQQNFIAPVRRHLVPVQDAIRYYDEKSSGNAPALKSPAPQSRCRWRGKHVLPDVVDKSIKRWTDLGCVLAISRAGVSYSGVFSSTLLRLSFHRLLRMSRDFSLMPPASRAKQSATNFRPIGSGVNCLYMNKFWHITATKRCNLMCRSSPMIRRQASSR